MKTGKHLKVLYKGRPVGTLALTQQKMWRICSGGCALMYLLITGMTILTI